MESCGKDAPKEHAGRQARAHARTQRRKHKSKANNANLFINLLSICSGPQVSSISVLFQSVTVRLWTNGEMRWRETHKAGDEEKGEEEEERGLE